MRHRIEARSVGLLLVPVFVCALLVTGCASPHGPSPAGMAASARETGYLSPDAVPNSLGVLPPPPEQGSAALVYDEAMSREALTLRNTPRWTLACEDADLTLPKAVDTFSCALDTAVSEKDAPHLYLLMARVGADASLSTRAAKEHYHRARPFVENREPTCTPGDEEVLKGNGSYPSGHTTLGWAWALILAEIAPDRVNQILSRGLAFGESRVVCNVHWESDVVAGRTLGAGLVARLHADPAFLHDLEAAKAEFAAARAKGVKPQRDCAAESAAMGK